LIFTVLPVRAYANVPVCHFSSFLLAGRQSPL
jgi:hypothetical protein